MVAIEFGAVSRCCCGGLSLGLAVTEVGVLWRHFFHAEGHSQSVDQFLHLVPYKGVLPTSSCQVANSDLVHSDLKCSNMLVFVIDGGRESRAAVDGSGDTSLEEDPRDLVILNTLLILGVP